MNSTRWIVGCFLLALAALLLAAGGCGKGQTATSWRADGPLVLLQAEVRSEGEKTVVEVQIRNISKQAVYI